MCDLVSHMITFTTYGDCKGMKLSFFFLLLKGNAVK